MRSFVIRFSVAAALFFVVVLWYFVPDSFFVDYSDATDEQVVYQQPTEEEKQKKVQEGEKVKIVETVVKDKIKQSVPFIVQAPHAQWDEPKFQDACEEASLIMADAWITGDRHIAKNDAEEEMEKMFAVEREMFGDVIDISTTDTAKLFQEYFGHETEVISDASMNDVYKLLADGNIVIVPTNGKWLENPQFTNGGPDRHMLVIIGYDKKNGEFITNDPGTRLGRGYKYKDSTLYNAIRDYETGNKKDIEGIKKTMIVVKK